jgi:bifunctional enzyme CysN/CysC
MSISTFLDQDEKKDLLRFITAGSVDDGKSTLIGRLLYDSKLLYEDQLATLAQESKRQGSAGADIDYALLLDGLKAEREQGITIDVAYRYFSTNKRKFIIADTPGHEQYTRNMVTGASTSQLAIVLIDAEKGVITQTKRHTFLIDLLGIKHLIVAINKMDLVNYAQNIFDEIVESFKSFSARLSIPHIEFVPLSALRGDNVVDVSGKMPWYLGKTLMSMLETIHISNAFNMIDFRYPVQYVLRPDGKYRGFAGRIASGIIRVGDELIVLPSHLKTRVKSINVSTQNQSYAFAGQSVSLELEDEIDISRGDLLVHPQNMPKTGHTFDSTLVWMATSPFDASRTYLLKHTTRIVKARLSEIRYKIDVNTMHRSSVKTLGMNDIARVAVTTQEALSFDAYIKNKETGAFVVIDELSHETVAVGMILDRVAEDVPQSQKRTFERVNYSQDSLVTTQQRLNSYQQKALTFWVSCNQLSECKTFAYELEKRLFESGKHVVVLDASLVGPLLQDKITLIDDFQYNEYLKIFELAKLLNDNGLIAIVNVPIHNISLKQDIKKNIYTKSLVEVFFEVSLKKNNKSQSDADSESDKVESREQIYCVSQNNWEQIITRLSKLVEPEIDCS